MDARTTNVRTIVERLLHDYGAFPETVAKYLIEHSGTYQDVSGPVIREMKTEGIIKEKRWGKLIVIYDPAIESRDPSRIEQCLTTLQTLMNRTTDQNVSGLMAELVFFIALARAYEEARSTISIRLWPKASYSVINGIDWEVDAQMVLRGEIFPIDVSNSIQHTMENYEKVGKAAQVVAAGLAKPILINRMASLTVRTQYLKWNSLVCDFGKLVLLDDPATQDARQAAEQFEIARFIHWVPPIKVAGDYLAGNSYHDLIRKRVNELLPVGISDFAAAHDQIPKDIMMRVRGLVRLLWVNGYYRQAETTDERILSLLQQWAYAYLLANGGPIGFDALLAYAEGRLKNPFERIFRDKRASFASLLGERIEILKQKGFLSRSNSAYSITDAVSPM